MRNMKNERLLELSLKEIEREIEPFKVGDYVHYSSGGKNENGIIKSLSDSENVFVVYHCNGDWVNYKDYTAERTLIRSLEKGWYSPIRSISTI